MTDEEYLALWRNRPASIPALLAAMESAVWHLARRFEFLSGLDAAGLANDARMRAVAAFDEFDPDRDRASLFPFVYQRMRWHLMAVTKDESMTVRRPRREWMNARPRAELSLSDPKPGRKVRAISADQEHPLDEMIRAEDAQTVRRALKRLKPRLGRVLWARAQGKTLETIGAKLGISRERARQLEAEGLQVLRRIILGSTLATRCRPDGETLSTSGRARARRSAPSCAPGSSPTHTPTPAGDT